MGHGSIVEPPDTRSYGGMVNVGWVSKPHISYNQEACEYCAALPRALELP